MNPTRASSLLLLATLSLTATLSAQRPVQMPSISEILRDAAQGEQTNPGGGGTRDAEIATPSGRRAAPPTGQAGLPAWLRTGVRVTYYSGSATFAGVRQQLVPGENGAWVDSQGRRYRVEDTANSAGAGYTQWEFAEVRPGRIATNMRNYIFADAGMQAVTRVSSEGIVGDANGLSDIWLPPAALRAKLAANELGVRRGPYELGGRTYDAIVIESKGSSGFLRYTYDLDSGLLLVMSSSSIGASVRTPDGDTSTTGAGSTMIAVAQLRDVRTPDVPWLGQAAPQWVRDGAAFAYAGTYRNSITEGSVAPWRCDARITLGGVASNAAIGTIETRLDYGNGQGQNGRVPCVYGPGAATNLWIDPAALQKLQRGQLLDRDPITGWQLSFAGSDGRYATIVERGTADEQSYTYDLQTGLMVATTSRQQQGPAVITISLELQQQRQ